MTRSQPHGDGTGATGGAGGVPVAPVDSWDVSKRIPRRSRASAKKAGSSFERATADYLADVVDDRIDRRVKNGAKDRGDIGGVRIHGKRVVLECKNAAKISLGPWAVETEIERGNDDALAGVIVHKRHGRGSPADQWVTMTLADFAALLTGDRTHINEGDE